MAGHTATRGETELDWIALAQKGDRQAFGELVSRYRESVVNVVYRMCGDPQLAEEAAQEAFLRAWQRLETFQAGSSFRSWICRIAINQALDRLRRELPSTSLDDLPLASPTGGPEVAVERQERASQVKQAVLALPPGCRAALILREYEGLSYQEIADALGLPIGTVMSRLSYARSQLRQALAGTLEGL
jgi:RNA polymerase sigma-70 factor (ECF subfamily)